MSAALHLQHAIDEIVTALPAKLAAAIDAVAADGGPTLEDVALVEAISDRSTIRVLPHVAVYLASSPIETRYMTPQVTIEAKIRGTLTFQSQSGFTPDKIGLWYGRPLGSSILSAARSATGVFWAGEITTTPPAPVAGGERYRLEIHTDVMIKLRTSEG